MGQGGSVGLVKDTIQAEQYLKYQQARHEIVHEAFQKCVAPTSEGATDPFDLRPEERNCVEEYSLLYAAFIKKEFVHFTALYAKQQRESYEKARQMYMENQARQELRQ